ncbi:MAG TPA: dihydroneopterin aldolase [Chitinophagaceae bacterium]|jgi:dihydroneopterin aldolase|nr:dihydroneopterin aldolase [Chitinophagaceae bacterium]
MPGQFTIDLKAMRFFAGHGLYAEEAIIGNEFEVDVRLTFPAPTDEIHSIEETVNYVEVFRLASETLSGRKGLLETCAMQLAARLRETFPKISQVSVSIKKVHPPITGFTGSIGVSFEDPAPLP